MLSTLRVLVCSAIFIVSTAGYAFDGLVVSELPVGGDVTVPSEYPIQMSSKMDVKFSGVSDPQSIIFVNRAAVNSVVKLEGNGEKRSRTITIKPGASTVYSFKNQSVVRVRVVSGDVRVSSLHPLKVQR